MLLELNFLELQWHLVVCSQRIETNHNVTPHFDIHYALLFFVFCTYKSISSEARTQPKEP